jgi:hypothetical protein
VTRLCPLQHGVNTPISPVCDSPTAHDLVQLCYLWGQEDPGMADPEHRAFLAACLDILSEPEANRGN